MRAIVNGELMLKLLEIVREEKSVSVHQLCCRTGSGHRTIKRYLELMVRVQESPRLKIETVGLRVFVRRENGTIPDAADRRAERKADAGLRGQDAPPEGPVAEGRRRLLQPQD